MKRCIIVFAKEPQKGRVKTRLSKYLSQKECLDLYKALLKDSLNVAKRSGSMGKIVAYDLGRQRPNYLSRVAKGFTFLRQRGEGLGERMHNAFLDAKADRNSKIIIIGSDAPTIPHAYIKEAFSMLDNKDLVLGPSLDGGYYLIGLKKPCFALFRGIKWSSKTVFADTLKRAKRLRKKVGRLKALRDIDEIEDLFLLKTELKRQKNKKNAQWTRRFLKVS